MSRRRGILPGVAAVALLFLSVQATRAFYVDPKAKTLEVTGKAQSRVSIRLQDSSGFTQPIDVHAGDLVQWRNLGILEVNHDLEALTRELAILYPFRVLKVRAKYHLVGRFLYEAVYDVGPEALQDVAERDPENIDRFKQAYDLWELYLDLSRGPLFIRLGRQNLAWGETDIFRLLDGINPLDNTFGGPFEDLDDRRIPLWMLRGSYNFGRVGPVSTLTLEGFWVPGSWDARVAPLSPVGTAYAAPQPPSPLATRVLTPEKDLSNSRWGVRLMGMLADNFNFSLAHYRSFLDIPSLRLAVGESPLDAAMEISFPEVQVTGASLSFWEAHTDIIVRTEVAWFWEEPVFIPDINTPLVPLPISIPGVPGLPMEGEIPEKDILRYMIGLDKTLSIPALNPAKTFLISLQYFGSWVQDYDERMRQPLALYPNTTDFTAAKETEGIVTALVNTDYLKGELIPQLAVAYDLRGVWLIQPSVNYVFEPLRVMIQYSAVSGNMTSFGAYRDRDQISFILSYLLN
ncbi:MAG: DUF1302 family protein [bacterium]